MFAKRTLWTNLVIISLVCLGSGLLYSHGGRTDKYGGHKNRKTGDYHFHNAGRAHHPSNPYQNHKTCGKCSTSKPEKSSLPQNNIQAKKLTASSQESIMALQAGLKCMGYKITNIDGHWDTETQTAIKAYIATQTQK